MDSTRKAFIGHKVVLDDTIEKACIVVEDGKITDIIKGEGLKSINRNDYCEFVDAGDDVIIPGVVDSHVHVNEPGRTAWEGYFTATQAAAVGGITTIIDMPLNCIPSTTTVSAFVLKLEHAKTKCFVDVGFWGGIVPGNDIELRPMLNTGVLGFKCFLIHSGVDDFPAVDRFNLEMAMKELQGTDAVVLFHAEMECGHIHSSPSDDESNPRRYQTFLDTRPDCMEVLAIRLVCELCLKYRVRCHIVHLSSANALDLIVDAKKAGAPLTVETCHHYLSLEAEAIPDGATQYKCCPPIRAKQNQEALWKGLRNGDIDMVVSDHSPCTSDLKETDTGNCLTAWGGISSVQFGLSLFWTKCQRYGMDLHDLVRLLCQNTATLAGLGDQKGAIRVGCDADLVIWNPQAAYEVTKEIIRHKNKLTPYEGMALQGVVKTTVVGGNLVYDKGVLIGEPRGKTLLKQRW